jgi:hypothetical protein
MKNKNIWLLPTNKPSRLFDDGIELHLGELKDRKRHPVTSYNIYITSDEEIKEHTNVKNKWVISEYGFIVKADKIGNNYLKHSNGGSNFLHHYKFIILTTDQNLINDGVQKIEDDFLEWFVKNPNCEKVEVERIKDPTDRIWFNTVVCRRIYKIIIPKEEPKQILCGQANKFYRCVTCDSPCGSEGHFIKEPKLTAEFQEVIDFNDKIYKQETLEEAAERIGDMFDYEPKFKAGVIYGVIEGAKLQQEQDLSMVQGYLSANLQNIELLKRSYSEEEVVELLNKSCDYIYASAKIGTSKKLMPNLLIGWFEQFKKK